MSSQDADERNSDGGPNEILKKLLHDSEREPFPELFGSHPHATPDELLLKINTERLDSYLNVIKHRLENHDRALREQNSISTQIAKHDEERIARLSVRLDHLLVDVNGFKDVFLKQMEEKRSSSAEDVPQQQQQATTINAANREIKITMNRLQADMEAAKSMLRRIELHQSDEIETFGNLKQLQVGQDALWKEFRHLDSNPVVESIRALIRTEIAGLDDKLQAARDQRLIDLEQVNSRFLGIENDALGSIGEKLTFLEEKLHVYDALLLEEADEEEEEEEDGQQQEHAATGKAAITNGGGEEETLGFEPLSQKQKSSAGNESAVALVANQTPFVPNTAAVAVSTKIESSAVVVKDTKAPPSPAAEERRLTRRISNRVMNSQANGNGNAQGEAAAAAGGGGGMGLLSSRMTQSGKRSSFFMNLMADLVTRDEFGSAQKEFADNVRGSFARVNKKLRSKGAARLFWNFDQAHVRQVARRLRRGFDIFVENVQVFHTTRNRRNRQKSMILESRMFRIVRRHKLAAWMTRWREMNWKWRERERLYLHLQNCLRHWVGWVVPNVKRALVKWKKFALFRYYKQVLLDLKLIEAADEAPKPGGGTGDDEGDGDDDGDEDKEQEDEGVEGEDAHQYGSSNRDEDDMEEEEEDASISNRKSKKVKTVSAITRSSPNGWKLSDNFTRLLEHEGFRLHVLKQVVFDEIKRMVALGKEQERTREEQEKTITDHIDKITAVASAIQHFHSNIMGGGNGTGGLGGASSEAVEELRARADEIDEGLRNLRLDVRKIFNQIDIQAIEQKMKSAAETRKILNDFNNYKTQVTIKFNEEKETVAAMKDEMHIALESQKIAFKFLEGRVKGVETRLDNEDSKLAPLQDEQTRMQGITDKIRADLGDTNSNIEQLNHRIDSAMNASNANIENNQKMEAALVENAEFYDEELKFMRKHVVETVSGLQAMKDAKATFVDTITQKVQMMTVDLDNFVERMPRGQEIFDICMDYEDMWVRLHSEGLDSGPELHQLPDILHERISHLSLRIAHHIAAAADRLVLAQWSGGLTGKKPPINPQQASGLRHKKFSFAAHVSDGPLLIGKRSKLSSDTNQNWVAGGDVPPELILDQNKTLRESGFVPTPDLIAHVREELFQNYLSIGLVPMLKALDDSGPNDQTHSNTLLSSGVNRNLPGILRATGRATFLRKLKKSVNVALSKFKRMEDPSNPVHHAALSSAPFSNGEFGLCLACGQGTDGAHNPQSENETRPMSGAPRPKTLTYPNRGSSSPPRQVAIRASDLYGKTKSLDPSTNTNNYNHRPEEDEPDDLVINIVVPPVNNPASAVLLHGRKDSAITLASQESIHDHNSNGSEEDQLLTDPNFTKHRIITSIDGGIVSYRPSSTGATRHREAVRDQHQYYFSTRPRSANNERENAASIQRVMNTQSTVAGAGFIFRNGETGQEPKSESLASQLASPFPKDKTFPGGGEDSNNSKLVSDDSLELIQSGRKLFGAHQD